MRFLLPLTLLVAFVVVPPILAGPAPLACVDDPIADVGPLQRDHVDMVELCVGRDGPNLVATVTLAEASDPLTDPRWANVTTTWTTSVDLRPPSGTVTLAYRVNEGVLDVVISSTTVDVATCSATGAVDQATLSWVVDLSSCASLSQDIEDVRMTTFVLDGTTVNDIHSDASNNVVPRPGEDSPIVPTGPQLERLEGPSRFETAITISQFRYPDGAAEVYLARADSFADALAGTSLGRGPILLVPQCGDVPAPVAEEVRRLNPARVFALGGEGAVCDDLLEQLAPQ